MTEAWQFPAYLRHRTLLPRRIVRFYYDICDFEYCIVLCDWSVVYLLVYTDRIEMCGIFLRSLVLYCVIRVQHLLGKYYS